MADKMLVVITGQRKLWKWPWSEQKHRVKFLVHGRQPFELDIRGGEGYDQFFKRVFKKEPILRFDPNARPRKWKARRKR